MVTRRVFMCACGSVYQKNITMITTDKNTLLIWYFGFCWDKKYEHCKKPQCSFCGGKWLSFQHVDDEHWWQGKCKCSERSMDR